MSSQSPAATRIDPETASPGPPRNPDDFRVFARAAIRFVLVGLILYAILYAAAEVLTARTAVRNRFHVIRADPARRYDFVLLGASHAAVFDYRDMNARLEEMTGAGIINLATVGGGITPNRLLLDYFLQHHQANTVVYVVDSFVFGSAEWNEDRLADASLYVKAPLDPALAALLFREPAARGAALGYISGFSKINDRDRFKPDLFEAEGSRFDRAYRPIAQIDRQRIEYLYGAETSTGAAQDSYLGEFEELIEAVQARGMRFVALRPPIPERVYAMLPGEPEFERTLRALLNRHGADLIDLSSVNNDPAYFYDTDHLNLAGVEALYENHLAPALRDLMEGRPD
jgi:hypothetical protein